MTKQRITRRQVLAGAGAAGGIAALARAAPALAKEAATTAASLSASSVVGSWVATVHSPGSPVSFSLLTFDAGGGIVETDSTDESSSGHASPGHGAWAGTGGNTFVIKVLKFAFDPSGHPVGYIEFAGPNELDSANTAQGSGKVKVFTFSGKVLFTSTYTYEAKRIQAGLI
jgi:hypothetical protein